VSLGERAKGTGAPLSHRIANQCSACGLDFTGISDFDSHRIGKYPQTGPADWLDRVRTGLVDIADDWYPEFGRRCLDTDEMEQAGWYPDRHGRWSHPRRLRKRVGVAQNRSEAPRP
jgi:hypothetical protein